MADPLSVLGGIAAILQISSTVVGLIKAAKGATTDRQLLLIEINATTALCQTLRDYAEMDAGPWTAVFQVLDQNDVAPLPQFRKNLEHLQKKLIPETDSRSRLRTWGQNLKWPFAKSEVLELIASIERQKSLFNIAMTNDNVRLSMAIWDETQGIARTLDAVQVSMEAQGREAQQVAKDVDHIRLHYDDEVQKSRDREKYERKQTLLAQLTTIDFNATHADISSRRAQNTGSWLLERPEYISWQSKKSSSVLWCRGIPGAGKTVLASLIIDSLRGSGAIDCPSGPRPACNGVAGIYCSYQNPQAIPNILGSLLQQLLLPLYNIPDSFQMPANSQSISAMLSNALEEYIKSS